MKDKVGKIVLFLTAIALLGFITTRTAAATYNVTDLGVLGGGFSEAFSINASAQVVGWSETATSGVMHAFLWQNGVMTDLGTLGGLASQAFGINDSGQVVGWAQTASGVRHAFLWQNGVMIDLGTLGGLASQAFSINDSGQVVGWASNASGGGGRLPLAERRDDRPGHPGWLI